MSIRLSAPESSMPNLTASLRTLLVCASLCSLAGPAEGSGLPSTAQRAPAERGAARLQVAQPEASPASAAALSPRERANLTRRFVRSWGMYVQRVYGVPVEVWSQRMVPTFVAADSTNFREAVARETFEGALAVLSGTGHLVMDEATIRALADDGSGLQAIGALGNDLAYTPVAPCRILDTRVSVGAIAANSTRSFVAINAANFSSQGGSATNCGTLGINATAVAINLTAVTPSGAGYATAYPFNTTQPLASSVNYTAGAIVNNALIVQIPNPLSSFDFTLYTFAQSHYVADIVGYFAPPVATALQCVTTAKTTVDLSPNGGTGNAFAPACASGYTQTGTNCETSSWLTPIVYASNGTCSARNGDSSTQQVQASRVCCRVPGR
jgi:hypothetical protein